MVKHQTRACLFVIDVKGLAPGRASCDTLFCLFQALQVILELLFRLKAGAIDSLQHGICFQAVPIGPGNRKAA
jgi:hypothetical protein